MGIIGRIVEQRAEVEAEALVRAREVCENKMSGIDVRISSRIVTKEKAQADFYVADDNGDESTANSLLKRISAIQADIKNLQRDKESWGNLDNILFRIESLVFLLQQHGEYWTIVRALPYRKLKKERYSSQTAKTLTDEFVKIYELLRTNAWRLAKQDDTFAHKLEDVNRTFTSLDEWAEETGPQNDVISELRKKLREERSKRESTLEPVEKPETAKDTDVRKKTS